MIRVILIEPMSPPEYREIEPTDEGFHALVGTNCVEKALLCRAPPHIKPDPKTGAIGLGAYVDHEGINKRLPPNGLATFVFQSIRKKHGLKILPENGMIVGPMVICGINQDDDACSVPGKFRESIIERAFSNDSSLFGPDYSGFEPPKGWRLKQ